MAELHKTGESSYQVLIEDEVVGQVWNWHGIWSAQACDEIYHGLKSRKKAVEQVIRTHELSG